MISPTNVVLVNDTIHDRLLKKIRHSRLRTLLKDFHKANPRRRAEEN